MAKKIDYSKVEQQLNEAMVRMQIEQLTQGKPITSSRAEAFYGLDTSPRPVHEDPVEKLLEEEALEQQERLEDSTSPSDEEAEEEETLIEPKQQEKPPTVDVMTRTPSRRSPPVKRTEPLPKTASKELYDQPVSDLVLLRRHIFWMKQHGIKERYELIGTTQEEIFGFRKKVRLSDTDKLRIQTLLQKAEAMREKLLEQKGQISDESLIEKEQKRHKTKRFNVREKWIPL